MKGLRFLGRPIAMGTTIALSHDVFDAAHGYAFSVPRFREWWTERDRNRLIAA